MESEIIETIDTATEKIAELMCSHGWDRLTAEEKKIIVRVALTFPRKQMVIDAAHREQAYLNKKIGEIIPYSDASKLTEILL